MVVTRGQGFINPARSIAGLPCQPYIQLPATPTHYAYGSTHLLVCRLFAMQNHQGFVLRHAVLPAKENPSIWTADPGLLLHRQCSTKGKFAECSYK
ncbi:hypothetical protein D3C77_538180 [compost metagenome]